MKFSKKHFVAGLIGNAVLVILGIVATVLITISNPQLGELFKYFTVISNLLVVLVSLVGVCLYASSIAKNKNRVSELFQIIKLITVVGVAITFTIVLVFLLPNNPNSDFYDGFQLYLHAIIPLFAVFSFLLLEYPTKLRFRFFFLPILLPLLYGVFYFAYAFLAPAGSQVDWYGFMFEVGSRVAPVDVSKFTFGNFFLFIGESLGAAAIFGFVFWLVNRIANLIFIGYVVDQNGEEVDEAELEATEEEVKEEAEPEAEDAPKAKAKSPAKKISAPKKYKDGARVYHIARSKFVSRHWQVKLAGGEKAIKIFDTQKEAIDYAKKLVRSQGGSIRIHSMKGQLRK